jgi:hypothetical protein
MLDEFPALKSSFDNVDPDVFNVLMDRLVRQDPELSVIFMNKTASTMYGPDAVLPELARDMSESFRSYHNAYYGNEDGFSDAITGVKNIITIEPEMMRSGINSLSSTLSNLKNVDEISRIITPQDISFSLERTPVAAGTFQVWVDGVLTGEDNGSGLVIPVAGVSVNGTINYYTGQVVFDQAVQGTSIECRYGAVGSMKWDLFNYGQEFEKVGYNSIGSVIDMLDIMSDFYGRNPDLDYPSEIIVSFLRSLQTSTLGVEAKIDDISSFLQDEELAANEKLVADWLVADRDKVALSNYFIDYFYPIVLNPVLDKAPLPADFDSMDLPLYIQNEDDYKNIIRRTRWIIDEASYIYAASPRKITGKTDASETLFLKSFMGGLSKDIDLYDQMETIPMFDFINNDMLKWADQLINTGLNPALAAIPGTKTRFKQVLWDGWRYYPTVGDYYDFKGIFKVGNPDINQPDQNDGYVTRMAKTKSSDLVNKPFRLQVDKILNKDDPGSFKDIRLSYATQGDGARGESQLESIVSNLYLYILSHYFSPDPLFEKWALTPEDGKDFFGDSTRNLQTLFGNMSTSIRNMAVLDKNGKKYPEAGSNTLPMLSELLYVIAAGYGITDPNNAPKELTLRNCLKSMGSPQLGIQEKNSLSVNGGIFGTFNIPVLGSNQTKRRPDGGTAVTFATQPAMTAMELLQPGVFRERTGVSTTGHWKGRFSSSQGDIIGIQNAAGNIVTSNWTITEIALSAWEGYGPYTYMGKAPNGSECKYKNTWYTDEYFTEKREFLSPGRGPGMSGNYSKYKIYEKIYRPTAADGGVFVPVNGDSPKYGYKRNSSTGGSYTTITFSEDNKVVLDCATREEAVRKNFNWLMNEKKYVFLIPMHAYLNQDVWGGLARVKMEMYVYASINANGVMGIAKARRYKNLNDIRDNAKWPGATFNGTGFTSIPGEVISSSQVLSIRGRDNTVLKTISDDNNSFSYDGVSFKDQDFMVALDYTYDFSAQALWGLFTLPGDLTADIMNGIVTVSGEIWGCLGDGSVLPASVGQSFDSVANLGSILYIQSDLMTDYANQATSPNMIKFKKFFDEYYADAGLFNGSQLAEGITDKMLPPVPRVKGVSYPTNFNESGAGIDWVTYTGESKGKFEDILGIFTLAIGTMHEDGDVYTNINVLNGTVSDPADYDARNTGNIAFFAKDGFRSKLDDLILLVAALNEHKKDPNLNTPKYLPQAWINIMIDHNGSSVVPGSRAGALPKLLSSKYLNINNPEPIEDGIESVIRHTIRSFFNSFELTKGFNGSDWKPETWGQLDPLYKEVDGKKVDIDEDGYSDFNPNLDWNIPLNKLRYVTSDRSIDQLERMLDYLRDLSLDPGIDEGGVNDRPAFKKVVEQTIIAFNTLMRIRYMNDNPEGDPSDAFYLNITQDNLDDIIDFLQNTDYKRIFSFIKEKKLNDLDKFYNFTFEDWADATSEEDLKEIIDEINENLIKYFQISVKEALVYGVYKIKTGADLTDINTKWGEGAFTAGETVYGYGKYVRIDEDITGDGDIDFDDKKYTGSEEIIDETIVDGEVTSVRYYEYLDITEFVRPIDNEVDENIFEISFAGLTEVFTIRTPGAYEDKWYKAGLELSPNLFSFHIYDIRLDKAFDLYNKYLVEDLTAAVFDINQGTDIELVGKNNTITYNRPKTFIDWLYGVGSPTGRLSLQHEVNFFKDLTLKSILDENEITLYDPVVEEDRSDTLRNFIGVYRQFLNDNVFKYEYTKNGQTLYENYMPDYEDDIQDDHLHVVNNLLEVVSVLFDRKSTSYVTNDLYKFFEEFLVEAKNKELTPETLKNMRESVGALLFDRSLYWNNVNTNTYWDDAEPFDDLNLNGMWDAGEPFTDLNGDTLWSDAEPYGKYDYETDIFDSEAAYTGFFAKIADKSPKFLDAYKGSYDELVRVAILAFEPGGIGEYMLETMEGGEKYEMLDYVNEIDMLLNQDVFQTSNGRDTFWWQVGSMLDAFSVMIAHENSIDYSSEIRSIFK